MNPFKKGRFSVRFRESLAISLRKVPHWLISVIFVSFLVDNLIVTLCFLILSGMSIFYVFYEKDDNEDEVNSTKTLRVFACRIH